MIIRATGSSVAITVKDNLPETLAGRPFIAAMVISTWRGDIQVSGFFYCAAGLARFAGDAAGSKARASHAAELNAVLALWALSSEALAIEVQQTICYGEGGP